jgi:F0F1-type ATP synthase epsilon subunit
MFRKLKTVMVELNTPRGSIFSGPAAGVELRIKKGAVAINPREESYLNMIHPTELTLRVGKEFVHYVLKNAVASFLKGRLTVLAEEIQERKRQRVVPPEPFDSNAMSTKTTPTSRSIHTVIRSNDRHRPQP